MNGWIPVIAALGGTVVGGLIGWWVDERRWRREKAIRWDDARYMAYARFLGASLRFSYRWTGFVSRRDFRRNMEYVRQLSEEVFEAMAEADLLSSDAVKEATDQVAEAVTEIVEHSTISYTQRRFGAWQLPRGKEYAELREKLTERRRSFSKAVHKELGIPFQ